MPTTKVDELAQVRETLQKIDKALGMARWELEGAGAKKKAPSTQRARSLKAQIKTLVSEQKALRKQRDELKQREREAVAA